MMMEQADGINESLLPREHPPNQISRLEVTGSLKIQFTSAEFPIMKYLRVSGLRRTPRPKALQKGRAYRHSKRGNADYIPPVFLFYCGNGHF
jgi:hypothetical protein